MEKPQNEVKSHRTRRIVEEIELLLAFTFFGIAGGIGRTGLIALTAFEGLGSVWPNFTGCLIMGMSPLVFNSVMLPVITTGFCGSITTFSQMMTTIFLVSTHPQPNWPNHGYGVPMFMARLILELSCSAAGYLVGQHIGRLHNYLGFRKPSVQTELLIKRLCELLGIAAWVVCLVTTIVYGGLNRKWALSGVFSPFGVFARYYLAKLNKADKWFKTGTFAANIIGTFLTCIFQTCEMLTTTSELQKIVLISLQQGLIGCLTTISTFIKELNTTQTGMAYIYAVITLFCGYSLCFIIIGSYMWTT